MKVLTWNLWWRFGDWRARQSAIEATLRAERPDVCCLQEVWVSGADSLAARLADRLGYHCTLAPAPLPARWQGRSVDPAPGVGVAVLSRWPVSWAEHARLPGLDGPAWPVLHAVVDAPTGPVPVFCVHLHSAPAGSAVRRSQVRHIARYVADRAVHAHPPVVAGDFNALPESDEIRLMEGVLTAPAVAGQVLVDAWRYADEPVPGTTWDRRNPHVAATGEPSGRIDYVFVGPPGSGGLGAVRWARLAGDRPVDGTWPSDHAAVLVDLRP
jgi:endonuclease/exonuclease/phosphatase family metal-dependent hydrolase